VIGWVGASSSKVRTRAAIPSPSAASATSEVPLSQAIMLRFIVLCPPARQDDLDDRD
jgi:hypothetical protein